MSQNIEAGTEYRTSSPPGVSKEALSTDAPHLLILLDQFPFLLVYTKSSPDFEALRAVFNTAVNILPLAIIRPQQEAEAASVVSHCAHHSIPISVRSGRHDFWGRSLVSNGVVIDMGATDSVTIAGDKSSARIGVGVIGSKFLSFLEEHDLFTPVGFCSSVGYVGWATGAEYGLMQGSYGLGVDQILGVRIVIASGEVVDSDNDPQLLWAIRGAGSGTLGIIVEMRVKIYKRPKILGGIVVFGFSEVGVVLRGFDELITEDFPDTFSGDFITPYLPGMGRVLAFLFAWPDHEGNFAQARLYLEKICSLGTVLLNTVNDTTLKSLVATIPMVHCPYYFTSRIIKYIGPDFGDMILRNPPVDESVGLIIHNAHGIGVQPCSETSFGIRKPHLVVGIAGTISPSGSSKDPEFKKVEECAERLVRNIESSEITLDTAYMNFTSPAEYQANQVYEKEDLAILRKVKRKYDPNNIFSKGSPTLL